MTSVKELFKQYIRPLEPIATGVAPQLSGMRRFQAILFDVYGTLLIIAPEEIDATQPSKLLADMLGRYGIRDAPAQIIAAFRNAIDQSHQKAHQQGVDHPEIDIISIWQTVLGIKNPEVASAVALEYELIHHAVYAMPGLAALLATYRQAGVTMGIISNAQFYTPPLLEHFLGASLAQWGFDPRLIFFSWQWGQAKPASLMFQKAKAVLAQMNIAAEDTLFVGNDVDNDIVPAKAIGFKAALFAGDQRSLRLGDRAGGLQECAPDLTITDLRQLIAATRDDG
ncbi:MAG: HAD family hydrolase [Desulfobacteraceae bacterium]|nr:HAD family hydrolase [Desulfobacteraceae bacterium]